MADITGPPTMKVTLGAISKASGSYEVKADWTIPAWMRDNESPNRAEMVDNWFMVASTLGTLHWMWNDSNAGLTSRTFDLNNLTVLPASQNPEPPAGVAGNWLTGTYRRNSYYPFTPTRIMSMTMMVRLWNSCGWGPWASMTRMAEKPPAPTIDDPATNEQTGVTSVTARKVNGDDWQEQYDRELEVTIYDSRTGETVTRKATSTEDTVTVTYDVADYLALQDNDFIHYTCRAKTRGWAGDSKVTTRNYYIAVPRVPTITKLTIPTRQQGDRLTMNLSTNAATSHPVTGVRLQKLVSSDAQTPEEAIEATGWADMNVVDNGNCSAMSARVDDVIPERGKTSWLRVKTWNEHENLFYRYSKPVRLTQLERPLPTPADDPVKILSVTTGAGGESAVLLLGWDPDGTDDSDGTEVTWADDENAWRSTKAPTSHKFEWSDGPLQWEGTNYRGSATLYVDGLTNGTQYWFRARRYMGSDDGEWSNTESVITSDAPASVTLVAPASIAIGDSLQLVWAYSSASQQRHWEVHSEGRVVDLGDDPMGSKVLPWDRVEPFVENGIVTMSVLVSTGGAMIESNEVEVIVDDRPVVTVDVSATVDEQPISLALGCDRPCPVSVVVYSEGADGEGAAGPMVQAAGDTIWTETVTPSWVSGVEGFTATVTAPERLALWDRCGYRVEVVATDEVTGLASETAVAGFMVEWDRKAPVPKGAASIATEDATDAAGYRTRSATVTLEPVSGIAEGDTYNVYRVTSDGPYLVAEGMATDAIVIDSWVPFGGSGLAYRIETVTPDGATAWWDEGFEFGTLGPTDDGEIRVDFGGDYVELERGVTLSDDYKKDFEARMHLDGTPAGYWDKGVTRTTSGTTQVLRVAEESTIKKLRKLARHAGPCFVRTSDGCAYQADVQVKGPSIEKATAGSTVTLAISEVALTREYMARIDDSGEGE